MIILQRKPFKIKTKIITKYRKIISSCYFAQLRIIFASIEKYEIKFLKNYSFCNYRELNKSYIIYTFLKPSIITKWVIFEKFYFILFNRGKYHPQLGKIAGGNNFPIFSYNFYFGFEWFSLQNYHLLYDNYLFNIIW